jgi:hypothetical protein
VQFKFRCPHHVEEEMVAKVVSASGDVVRIDVESCKQCLQRARDDGFTEGYERFRGYGETT